MVRAVSPSSGEVIDLSTRRPFDPWRSYVNNFALMLNAAKEEIARAEEGFAEGKKQNYRNFNVACSVLGVNPEDHSLFIATAPNTKPSKTKEKVCAETRAIKQAQKVGAGWIIGLVVVGEPQKDPGLNYEPDTLWCCETCRATHIVNDVESDTLIATHRPARPVGQIQTASELLAFQDAIAVGEDPVEVPTFHNREAYWQSAVGRYNLMVPPHTDVLESPESRLTAVNAARIAIQGFTIVAA